MRTPSRLISTRAFGVIGAAAIASMLTLATGLGAQSLAQESKGAPSAMRDTKASGVTFRLKDGAKVTPSQVAARNKVPFDEISPGMFGSTKLILKSLVPFSESAEHAERLRADPDVASAWVDYVIETSVPARP